MKECEGYKIIESIKVGNDLELVIGHNPEAYQPYVCWYSSHNGKLYDTGAYCFSYRQAVKSLAERIMKLDHYIPAEYERRI